MKKVIIIKVKEKAPYKRELKKPLKKQNSGRLGVLLKIQNKVSFNGFGTKPVKKIATLNHLIQKLSVNHFVTVKPENKLKKLIHVFENNVVEENVAI